MIATGMHADKVFVEWRLNYPGLCRSAARNPPAGYHSDLEPVAHFQGLARRRRRKIVQCHPTVTRPVCMPEAAWLQACRCGWHWEPGPILSLSDCQFEPV